MSGGSQTQSSQVATSEPWKPIGKKIENQLLPAATQAFKSGAGFDVFPNDWYVKKRDETKQALGQMTGLANQGNPLAGQGIDLSSGLMNGQYGPDTMGDYRGLLGNVTNDARQQAIDAMVGKVGDDITRQFGGSSFGSAAHSGTLIDQLGDLRAKAEADDFYTRLGAQRGLLGDITGLGQMDVQNRLAGFGIADPAYQFQYAPSERLAQVGATLEGYDAAKKQGNMDKFNAEQAAKLGPINWLGGILGGQGGYGTTSSTVSTPSNPWASALGGGLLGGQAFGPVGGAAGGILGLLSGL